MAYVGADITGLGTCFTSAVCADITCPTAFEAMCIKDSIVDAKISEHTFWNITIWSICAIALFFIFAAFFTGGDLNKLTDPESRPRLVTTVIAMLGIITAAGALVMKYQDEMKPRVRPC